MPSWNSFPQERPTQLELLNISKFAPRQKGWYMQPQLVTQKDFLLKNFPHIGHGRTNNTTSDPDGISSVSSIGIGVLLHLAPLASVVSAPLGHWSRAYCTLGHDKSRLILSSLLQAWWILPPCFSLHSQICYTYCQANNCASRSPFPLLSTSWWSLKH